MGFGSIIIIRILFIACMVFIIGYIFGGFSKKAALVTTTKVAAILVIILFIATNMLFMINRFGHCKSRGNWQRCDTVYRQDRHP
jgi:low affinity Fe/Cu permease